MVNVKKDFLTTSFGKAIYRVRLDMRGHMEEWTWEDDPYKKELWFRPRPSYGMLTVFWAVFSPLLLFVLYNSIAGFLVCVAFLSLVAWLFKKLIRWSANHSQILIGYKQHDCLTFQTRNKWLRIPEEIRFSTDNVLLLDTYVHARDCTGLDEIGNSTCREERVRILLVPLLALPGGSNGINTATRECLNIWGEGRGEYWDDDHPSIFINGVVILETNSLSLARELVQKLHKVAGLRTVDSIQP